MPCTMLKTYNQTEVMQQQFTNVAHFHSTAV